MKFINFYQLHRLINYQHLFFYHLDNAVSSQVSTRHESTSTQRNVPSPTTTIYSTSHEAEISSTRHENDDYVTEKQDKSVGSTIAIILGCIIAIFILIFGLFVLVKKKRASKIKTSKESAAGKN